MTKSDGKPCIRCGTQEWYNGGMCKCCQKARNKTPKEIEYQKNYRKTHHQKITKNNKEYSKAYAKTPVGRMKAKIYRESEKGRAAHMVYEKSERGIAAKKLYTKSKRGRANSSAASARRRTRKSKAGGSYTAGEWEALCKHYNNQCLKCGSSESLQADHVVSVVNGGTSNIDNIQPLCKSCNASKGTRNTDYRKGGRLIGWKQEMLL